MLYMRLLHRLHWQEPENEAILPLEVFPALA